LAGEIAEKFGVQPEMIKDGGGVFDVTVDGRLIFSKHEVDRFPENSEVLSSIESLNADST